MSHAYCVARQFSGKHTPAFSEGPGFKFGTGHGGVCVDDTCEEKAYDQMGTQPGTYHRPCKYSDHLANGPHDEPASSTIYTAG